MGWHPGDLSAQTVGLRWAAENEVTWLVKMSRRCVPLRDWLPSLEVAIADKFYPTYSREIVWPEHPNLRCLRNECLAFHVESWLRCGIVSWLEAMQRTLQTGTVEPKIYRAALACYEYAVADYRGDEAFYGTWDWLREHQGVWCENYLWHQTSPTSHYHGLAAQLELPYTYTDFESDMPFPRDAPLPDGEMRSARQKGF